ncbi:MAG: cytochrome c biogenesis protein CcdA [bacterium]
MTELFEVLTDAVAGAPHVAVLASFAWGILSVILSPCHLASIPLVVAFIARQQEMTTRRAFLVSTAFAGGLLTTIAAIGVATALLGRMLGDLGSNVNYVLAAIFVVIGLHFLGIIPMPFAASPAKTVGRRGYVAAFLVGLIFGLAIGPCTFAFMAPMLGVTFSVSGSNLPYGILLLAAYGIGHSSVIVAAGTFTEAVEHYLKWTSGSRGVDILRKVCGVLIILAAVYLIL